MNRGIYTIASGAVAAQARLDSVAQNLANANTAGYKGERLVFRVQPLTPDAETTLVDPVLARTSAQVATAATVREFQQGPIRPSGNPLDVALSGDGFFAVATSRGERYTRAGNFTLDPDDYLVTQQGDRVQGENGDLRLPTGDVAIAEDGGIRVDGAQVGRLKVVTFGDHPRVVPEGATLFAAAPGAVATPVDSSAVRLHAGALEGANVDAVSNMVELVDVARGYEGYMRALQQLDQVAQKSIDDVGRV